MAQWRALPNLPDLFESRAYMDGQRLSSLYVRKQVGQVGQVGQSAQRRGFPLPNLTEERLVRLGNGAVKGATAARARVLPSNGKCGSFGAQNRASSTVYALVNRLGLGELRGVKVGYDR